MIWSACSVNLEKNINKVKSTRVHVYWVHQYQQVWNIERSSATDNVRVNDRCLGCEDSYEDLQDWSYYGTENVNVRKRVFHSTVEDIVLRILGRNVTWSLKRSEPWKWIIWDVACVFVERRTRLEMRNLRKNENDIIQNSRKQIAWMF